MIFFRLKTLSLLRYKLLIILFLFIPFHNSLAQNLVVLEAHTNNYNLQKNFSWLEDPSGELKIDDLSIVSRTVFARQICIFAQILPALNIH